jgi:hypothetical protein
MILRNCEIWFAKLDPKRPNNKFNKTNPTWELQIRTTSKDVKKDWEAAGMQVKPVDPDDGPMYYRVNLRKKSIKVDKSASSPVDVVDSKLRPIDPNTIGNGSIGNIRVYQYQYTKKDGTPGIVSVLMGVQITKHIVYTPKPRDDVFGEMETDTEVVDDSEDQEMPDAPAEAAYG